MPPKKLLPKKVSKKTEEEKLQQSLTNLKNSRDGLLFTIEVVKAVLQATQSSSPQRRRYALEILREAQFSADYSRSMEFIRKVTGG